MFKLFANRRLVKEAKKWISLILIGLYRLLFTETQRKWIEKVVSFIAQHIAETLVLLRVLLIVLDSSPDEGELSSVRSSLSWWRTRWRTSSSSTGPSAPSPSCFLARALLFAGSRESQLPATSQRRQQPIDALLTRARCVA